MTDEDRAASTSGTGERKGRRILPLVLLGWLAAAVAVGLVLASHADRTPKVLPTPTLTGTSQDANFERIREGMTEAVVGAVLGGPPGVYTGKERRPDFATGTVVWGTTTWSWEYPDCVVEVDFNRRGRAVSKRLVPPSRGATR